jgi:hypothetical protein
MGVRFACLDYLCALFARFATLSAQLLTRVSGVSDAGVFIIRLCRARTTNNAEFGLSFRRDTYYMCFQPLMTELYHLDSIFGICYIGIPQNVPRAARR